VERVHAVISPGNLGTVGQRPVISFDGMLTMRAAGTAAINQWHDGTESLQHLHKSMLSVPLLVLKYFLLVLLMYTFNVILWQTGV
jgi:hypothetical protein